MKRVSAGEFMILWGAVILAVLASPLFLLGHINQLLATLVIVLLAVCSMIIAGVIYPVFYNDDETPQLWWSRHFQRD